MMSLFRHNISLLAHLAVILAGLAVTTYGLVHFAGSFMIYAALNAHPFAEASGFKAVPALMIVGQHGITALAGLALTFFAGRAFGRTWRAGPPDDETVVGKSPFGRSIGLLIYGAGALYGSYGIIFGMGPLLDDYHLSIHGDTTTAQIVNVEPAPDIHWDVQRLTYEFRTRDGTTERGTANLFSYPARLAEEKGWIEVTYNTTNPAHSEAEFKFSLQFVLYFFAGQLVFLLIGIWGFAKNASALANRPPPPPPVAVDAAPMQPMAGPVRRAQFGKRGL
jgi:hypothetical protein